MTRLTCIGVLVAAFTTIGCGAAPTSAGSEVTFEWQTSVYADHPLVGEIWSTAEQRFLKQGTLLKRLRSASPLLLGERHDHPDHHRIQARVVAHLPPGAIVGFEMLDEHDAPSIGSAKDARSLRKAVGWDQSGWPAFELYQPIFEAIFAQGHTPRAIHPARRRLRALMMGPSSQSAAPGSQPSVLSSAGQATLKADINRAHCGYATPPIVTAMVKAQEFKDRWMSEHLSIGDAATQRVVIAGNGHVRKDYGLPNHLPNTTVSVGIIEVDQGKLSPGDYQPERYDYVWFTPRLDTLNPCDKYRRALEQMKKAHERRKKTHENHHPAN